MNCCSVAQIPQLLFPQHVSLFKRSCPFRLSLSFPYDVSVQSETKTILLLTFWFWLCRRMFFLRELDFPQAAGWACLFPEHFKACTVPWLHVIRAALVPDKSAEENPLEHWMLQPSAEEWPTTSASRRSPARPRSTKMLKYVLSWQRSRMANLVGEGSWQSSVRRRLWNIMIFIRNDNNKKERRPSVLQKPRLSAASLYSHQRHGENFLRFFSRRQVRLCTEEFHSVPANVLGLYISKGQCVFWVNYWQSKSVTPLRSFKCMRLHSFSQSWWK